MGCSGRPPRTMWHLWSTLLRVAGVRYFDGQRRWLIDAMASRQEFGGAVYNLRSPAAMPQTSRNGSPISAMTRYVGIPADVCTARTA